MPKFVMFVKGDPKPGQMPSERVLDAMARYNEELNKAGVLLDLNGLHPSVDAARVTWSGGKTTVTDGPFAESKELVAGYWIIDVRTMAEAVEWAKRAPMDAGDEFEGDPEIEIRQVFELEEFGESPAIERHRQLGEELEKQKE
jgi:hypothetical protein